MVSGGSDAGRERAPGEPGVDFAAGGSAHRDRRIAQRRAPEVQAVELLGVGRDSDTGGEARPLAEEGYVPRLEQEPIAALGRAAVDLEDGAGAGQLRGVRVARGAGPPTGGGEGA